ncbi:hypothetical protein M885DRAFT_510156 [Pelagophyceae sp. CCMP2097]|nr:hypothetical protein M885DRAFT_510156 [Pelagophyceae sp. CCMP2097]
MYIASARSWKRTRKQSWTFLSCRALLRSLSSFRSARGVRGVCGVCDVCCICQREAKAGADADAASVLGARFGADSGETRRRDVNHLGEQSFEGRPSAASDRLAYSQRALSLSAEPSKSTCPSKPTVGYESSSSARTCCRGTSPEAGSHSWRRRPGEYQSASSGDWRTSGKSTSIGSLGSSTNDPQPLHARVASLRVSAGEPVGVL